MPRLLEVSFSVVSRGEDGILEWAHVDGVTAIEQRNLFFCFALGVTVVSRLFAVVCDLP